MMTSMDNVLHMDVRSDKKGFVGRSGRCKFPTSCSRSKCVAQSGSASVYSSLIVVPPLRARNGDRKARGEHETTCVPIHHRRELIASAQNLCSPKLHAVAVLSPCHAVIISASQLRDQGGLALAGDQSGRGRRRLLGLFSPLERTRCAAIAALGLSASICQALSVGSLYRGHHVRRPSWCASLRVNLRSVDWLGRYWKTSLNFFLMRTDSFSM
jgi:hypothetical protein